jgi:acyl-CoA thioester hydrolase
MTWDYPTPFTLPLAPQIADIDGLKHVNNAVYVCWCEQVAWAHSNSLGLGIADYERINRAVAIRHSEYDYLQPSKVGDELVLGTWLVQAGSKLMLERRFQLVRVSDGETLMRGHWELVCIELSTGRVRRMPPEFDVYHRAAIAATGT